MTTKETEAKLKRVDDAPVIRLGHFAKSLESHSALKVLQSMAIGLDYLWRSDKDEKAPQIPSWQGCDCDVKAPVKGCRQAESNKIRMTAHLVALMTKDVTADGVCEYLHHVMDWFLSKASDAPLMVALRNLKTPEARQTVLFHADTVCDGLRIPPLSHVEGELQIDPACVHSTCLLLAVLMLPSRRDQMIKFIENCAVAF